MKKKTNKTKRLFLFLEERQNPVTALFFLQPLHLCIIPVPHQYELLKEDSKFSWIRSGVE